MVTGFVWMRSGDAVVDSKADVALYFVFEMNKKSPMLIFSAEFWAHICADQEARVETRTLISSNSAKQNPQEILDCRSLTIMTLFNGPSSFKEFQT